MVEPEVLAAKLMAVGVVEAPGRRLLAEGQGDPGSGKSCPHLWKREDHASVPRSSALMPTKYMADTCFPYTYELYI